MSLIERAEQAVDKKAAAELERKLRKDEFTLEDFRDQLKQIRKMGPLDQIVDMLPKIGPLANLPKNAQVDEKQLKQVEAIINSMTNQERSDHNVIDGKRRKRIAKGSGTSVQEVNQVLKQYMQMRQMMKQYGAQAFHFAAGGHGAVLLHHLAHLHVLLQDLVDFLNASAAPFGDALTAFAVDDVVIAALLIGHGVDDGFDLFELLVIDFGIFGNIR